MQTENKLGHNKPPKSVEELINDQGRIKLSNSIIRKLKRKVDDKGNYEAAWEEAEKVTELPIVFQTYHTLKEEVEKAFGSEPDELKAIFSLDDEN